MSGSADADAGSPAITAARAWPSDPIVLRAPTSKMRIARLCYASATLVFPLLGAGAAVARARSQPVSAIDWTLLVGMYLATLLGITLGYHRGLSHRAFVARPALEAVLLALGAMAGQGPILQWAA